MNSDTHYDLVVVGSGIIGLASAYAAHHAGLRVAVVERHARCIGASVRNFGFVTVTGQRRGEHWVRAMRTRNIWEQIAPKAGIQIVHQGLYVLAQRPEAMDVLHAFLNTEMGEHCRMLGAEEAQNHVHHVQRGLGVLYSPHELRVESRDAIGQLSRWLEQSLGIDFYWNTAVHGISSPHLYTSRGTLRAERCIVCPGHELSTLYPEALAQAGIRMCTLQMLRVQPANPIQLPGSVMSDLSLVRYEGYADLPEAAPLRTVLKREQAAYLDQGIHLIAVQSADGTLVVGDSHVYGNTEAPFSSENTDALIQQEMHRVLQVPGATVRERWTGTYASAADVVYKAQLAPGVVAGIVTGGTGASTSFAFAEELVHMVLNGG